MTDTPHQENNSAATGTGGLSVITDKAGQAAETVRETAGEAARRTVQTIEQNPLGVVVGGLALGVLAGALLPRTERERKALGPVGQRVTQGAASAARAAREAGMAELAAVGISTDAALDQVKKLIGQLGQAAKRAGEAAAQTGREQVTKASSAGSGGSAGDAGTTGAAGTGFTEGA